MFWWLPNEWEIALATKECWSGSRKILIIGKFNPYKEALLNSRTQSMVLVLLPTRFRLIEQQIFLLKAFNTSILSLEQSPLRAYSHEVWLSQQRPRVCVLAWTDWLQDKTRVKGWDSCGVVPWGGAGLSFTWRADHNTREERPVTSLWALHHIYNLFSLLGSLFLPHTVPGCGYSCTAVTGHTLPPSPLWTDWPDQGPACSWRTHSGELLARSTTISLQADLLNSNQPSHYTHHPHSSTSLSPSSLSSSIIRLIATDYVLFSTQNPVTWFGEYFFSNSAPTD